jgi:hypothetical protein
MVLAKLAKRAKRFLISWFENPNKALLSVANVIFFFNRIFIPVFPS